MIESNNFSQNKKEIRLHLSSSESTNYMQPMSEVLDNKNYPWLTFGFKSFPEATFENNVDAAFQEGINYIFKE
jgi:hypothetical protein